MFQDSLLHVVDDALASGVDVRCILSPEHGFRGDHQAETGDPVYYTDGATGLPVISAYALNATELASALSALGVTTIWTDMQDVGTRLYTFVWTMYEAMLAASLFGARFVVTDRPNPLNGLLVGGPLLNVSCCASGYGRVPITHVHGMTIGEMALLFNDYIGTTTGARVLSLEVVRTEGWQRGMAWEQTGLLWVPPSPNIPTPESALAYAATVFIEATTVAEGRGTTTPFSLFGAPFLNASALASLLNKGGPYSAFRAAYFNPSFSKYNGTDCSGVQWMRRVEPSFGVAMSVLAALRDLSGENFAWDGSWFGHPGTELIDQYAGTPELRKRLDAGQSAAEVAAAFSADASDFREARRPYLLYPE